MGFLTFLPFLLTAKGASLPTVGLALTLVFVGGAAGKLVCAWIGARIGVVATVWVTEGFTALGILALLPLPLEFGLAAAAADRRGAQRHLVGAVRLGAADGRAGEAHARVQRVLHRHDRIGRGRADPLRLIGDALGVPLALTSSPRWCCDPAAGAVIRRQVAA